MLIWRAVGRVSLALCVWSLNATARAEFVDTQIVQFEHDYLTVPGDSVFVLGDIPELGGGDVRRSLKMVPGQAQGGSLVWRLSVSLPLNTTYSYRFVRRDDDVADWKNASNASYLTDWAPGATAPASPPYRTLTVFNTGDASTSVLFTAGDDLVVPLSPTASDPNLKIAQRQCQLNGIGVDATVSGFTIDTPLHTVLRRGSQLFNYVPNNPVTASGTIQTFVIETDTIPDTKTINGVTGRGIRVYLPRSYAAHPERHYPVLYMHDGQNVFAPGGPFGCWFAETVTNNLINQGRIREILIVAIDNSPKRAQEYVPEFGDATVTNVDYNNFLVYELKPYIDANYRTLADRENTAIAGSSFGGIASLSLGLNHPSIFGKVGAFSTSFWAGQTKAKVSSGQLSRNVDLYMDSGDTNDAQEDTLQVRDALLNLGRVLRADFYYTVGFNQQHNEVAWNARLPEALTYLFPITDENNALETLLPPDADLNHDSAVNDADLALLLAAYGVSAAGDLNGDGLTSDSDLGLLLDAYGKSCP